MCCINTVSLHLDQSTSTKTPANVQHFKTVRVYLKIQMLQSISFLLVLKMNLIIDYLLNLACNWVQSVKTYNSNFFPLNVLLTVISNLFLYIYIIFLRMYHFSALLLYFQFCRTVYSMSYVCYLLMNLLPKTWNVCHFNICFSISSSKIGIILFSASFPSQHFTFSVC